MEDIFVLKTDLFSVTACRDCDVPGYLVITPTPSAFTFHHLSRPQQDHFGNILADVEAAIAAEVAPEKIYITRYSEGFADVHFHLFPRSDALAKQYLLETSRKPVIGEDIFGWARIRFSVDGPQDISKKTRDTAGRIALRLTGRLKALPKRDSLCDRFLAALDNTYRFESPIAGETLKKFSPLIWTSAVLIFIFRLFWGSEFIKFMVRWLDTEDDPEEVHPAWSDYYIILMPLLCLCMISYNDTSPRLPNSQLFIAYSFWRVFENVTGSFYFLVARQVFNPRPSRHEFRNLMAAVGRSVEVWMALVLAWLCSGDRLGLDCQPTLVQVIYFVSTSFSTVGYGDLTPDKGSVFSMSLAIVTHVTAILMISIFVARALSFVGISVGPVKR